MDEEKEKLRLKKEERQLLAQMKNRYHFLNEYVNCLGELKIC